MLVYLIWIAPEDHLSAPWLHSAWDEFARDDNWEGWAEDLKKAQDTHGADKIRVVTVSVDQDKIEQLFHPTHLGEAEMELVQHPAGVCCSKGEEMGVQVCPDCKTVAETQG